MIAAKGDDRGRGRTPADVARRRDQLNRAKEVARRTPGLRSARARVMTLVRSRPVLLHVLDRARGEWAWVGGLPRPMHTDPEAVATAPANRPADAWPVVLVLADHLEGEPLEAAVAAVAERQRRTHAFRPVFLLSARPSPAVRAHHYPFDLLSLPGEIDGDHAAYRARRVVSLVDHLGVSLVVRAADAAEARLGIDAEGRLLLDALAEHLNEREGV